MMHETAFSQLMATVDGHSCVSLATVRTVRYAGAARLLASQRATCSEQLSLQSLCAALPSWMSMARAWRQAYYFPQPKHGLCCSMCESALARKLPRYGAKSAVSLACGALAEEAHVHGVREGLPRDDLHLPAKAAQALRGGLHSQPAQQAATVIQIMAAARHGQAKPVGSCTWACAAGGRQRVLPGAGRFNKVRMHMPEACRLTQSK